MTTPVDIIFINDHRRPNRKIVPKVGTMSLKVETKIEGNGFD